MWSREQLAVKLFDAGAVRLGDIEAKEGRRTPIYFDLRVVVSHPTIMATPDIVWQTKLRSSYNSRSSENRISKNDYLHLYRSCKCDDEEANRLANELWVGEYLRMNIFEMAVALHLQNLAADIQHDILCGVPYAALPITAVMTVNTGTPMIMKRKETKLYATKKILEGIFQPKQKCLVIEDVVTSGGSLLETVRTLRYEGLSVTDALVVLDREQGGASVLKTNGVTAHSLFTMSELVKILKEAGRISDEIVEIVSDHIKVCQFGVGDNLEIAERMLGH